MSPLQAVAPFLLRRLRSAPVRMIQVGSSLQVTCWYLGFSGFPGGRLGWLLPVLSGTGDVVLFV
jgi:hypothetical protein